MKVIYQKKTKILKEIISNMGNNKTKEQEAKELKIMIPNQLITRLPILLTQKQAGNNSQKLNNEIRQIIYSLHNSKKLSKTIYNHLMNSI